MIHLGCAGWSLPRQYADAFPAPGSHLQRYATGLNAVEINSSFYRPHRPETYARWAASVTADFRFAVKLPKHITHELRLRGAMPALETFLAQCGQLGEHLGCLLVQLPPSLDYARETAWPFFADLRARYTGPVALEPRHVSWRAAHPMLSDLQIAQVAASPSRFDTDAQPGGWPGLVYWRLHGEPRIYHSAYADACLRRLAEQLQRSRAAGVPTWCIFDNTASGAAVGDALRMQRYLR